MALSMVYTKSLLNYVYKHGSLCTVRYRGTPSMLPFEFTQPSIHPLIYFSVVVRLKE